MGGTYSAPTDTKTPTILNFILREMFSRADLVDIYSMADPQKCSKYIVVASDALDAMFVKIRLNPAVTKDGTLYFQSIDGLTKGTSVAAIGVREMRKKYCNQIAFFFVRIFQTFAALTLTMLDSELPLNDPPNELPEEAGRQRPATFIDPRSFLGVSQAASAQPRGWFGGQHGGTLAKAAFEITRDSPYAVLNTWLTDYYLNETDSIPIPFKYAERSLLITQNSLYTIPKDEFEANRIVSRRVLNPEVATKGVVLLYTLKRGTNEYTVKSYMKLIPISSTKLEVSIQVFDIDGYTGRLPAFTPKSFSMESDYNRIWKYKGSQIEAARDKEIREVLPLFLNSEIRNYIAAEKITIMDIMDKYGYRTQTTLRGKSVYMIRGTDFYFEETDNKSVLSLIYQTDEFTIPSEKKTVKLIVGGILLSNENDTVIEEGGKKAYRIRLNFSKTKTVRTSPAGYEDTIPLPTSEPENFVKFTESAAGYEPKDSFGRTIPTYLTNRTKAILANKDEDLPDGTGIQYTKRGFPVPHNSDSMDEAFRVKALWKALVKDPPIKAHCIARATQLLSVNAIRGKMDEETFSSACRTTFYYQKDGSLPTPGQGIYRPVKTATTGKAFEGEFGILALAMLFFDRLDQNGMPKFGDSEQYKKFLANLKFAFEKTAAVPTGAAIPNRISNISEKLPGGVCERVGDKPLGIPKGLGSDLQGITRQLISQQVEHVGRAMELMFELFDKDAILGRRQFALNPKILAGGTPAVNAVAARAKELLLQYYVSCETTYRQGLGYIVNYDKKTPLRAYGEVASKPSA